MQWLASYMSQKPVAAFLLAPEKVKPISAAMLALLLTPKVLIARNEWPILSDTASLDLSNRY